VAEANQSRVNQVDGACEIVEVRNLADSNGDACSRVAVARCSDCGIQLCQLHAHSCAMCGEVFCPSCLSCHQSECAKPAVSERTNGRRKIA
jgi:hypothetical protein